MLLSLRQNRPRNILEAVGNHYITQVETLEVTHVHTSAVVLLGDISFNMCIAPLFFFNNAGLAETSSLPHPFC